VNDSQIPDFVEFEQRLKDTLSSAYNIERELGGGGMSRVFVATDRILGRKIVIKVLSPELTAEVNRGRFRREIQVAAQLQHPHIVPLLSAGEQDDLLYFTMPFIKGESLKTAVEKDGRLSVNEVLRVLTHVGEALDYAHDAGIVHRDIKPANILRSGSYSLITDFGVAKALNASMPSQGMTQTGMAIGTPAYMAPEQLAGDAAADHRIDIYAVGLLAYELLNGRSPFYGTTPQRMLAAVLTLEPQPLIEVRPDAPQWLSDLVMRCLAKEPTARPASARELLNTLEMLTSVSGEIRTMEQKVPHIVATPTPESGSTPVMTREDVLAQSAHTPTEEAPAVATVGAMAAAGAVDAADHGTVEPPDHIARDVAFDDDGYVAPKKSRTGLIAAVVFVLVLLTAGGFWMSQQGGSEPTVAATPPLGSPINVDSMAATAPAAPGVLPESTTVAAALPTVDSTAIKDSIRKARREAQKKALAQAESVRIAQSKVAAATGATAPPSNATTKARNAAAAMLSNASASKAFTEGATHMGGVLNSKRKGDLQTQIDAITPFLSQAGLTYSQFKDAVRSSGVELFDQYGRMLPDVLRSFANSR
jgi:tRNA A-37 threonylcarbamoyl transferase component Bud32